MGYQKIFRVARVNWTFDQFVCEKPISGTENVMSNSPNRSSRICDGIWVENIISLLGCALQRINSTRHYIQHAAQEKRTRNFLSNTLKLEVSVELDFDFHCHSFALEQLGHKTNLEREGVPSSPTKNFLFN